MFNIDEGFAGLSFIVTDTCSTANIDYGFRNKTNTYFGQQFLVK